MYIKLKNRCTLDEANDELEIMELLSKKNEAVVIDEDDHDDDATLDIDDEMTKESHQVGSLNVH